jgi:hypothetical protein
MTASGTYAIAGMQQGDHGFRDILTQAFPNTRELRAQRDRVYHGVAELIERARATGRLREDFVPEDVPLLLMANAGVAAATAEHAPESSDRLVGYILQAFASAAASELPPPAPRLNGCTARSPGTSLASRAAGTRGELTR